MSLMPDDDDDDRLSGLPPLPPCTGEGEVAGIPDESFVLDEHAADGGGLGADDDAPPGDDLLGLDLSGDESERWTQGSEEAGDAVTGLVPDATEAEYGWTDGTAEGGFDDWQEGAALEPRPAVSDDGDEGLVEEERPVDMDDDRVSRPPLAPDVDGDGFDDGEADPPLGFGP